MKKITLTGDNVILKIPLKKSAIELPEGAVRPDTDPGEKDHFEKFPEVFYASPMAFKYCDEFVKGAKVLTNVDFKTTPVVNHLIGEPDMESDKKATHVYFLVKSFDIFGVVSK